MTTPNTNTADVAIVGGGIIGMMTAYQIARRSNLRVTVLERGAGLGEGSTGASSAITRQRYTHSEMIRIAIGGNEVFANWSEFTGIAEPKGTYHPIGVLWIQDLLRADVEADSQRLHAEGAIAHVLDVTELRRRFPALSPCVEPFDLTGEVEHVCRDGEAFLLEEGCGYFDPTGALEDVAEAARREGVTVRMRSTVTDVLVESGKARAVVLADGSQIDADIIVNAAGPWCNEIDKMAGLVHDWDLAPTRIEVVYRTFAPEVPRPLPVVGDITSGIYFRPETADQQILMGSTLEEDEQELADPDDYNRVAGRAFTDLKIHALHHRIPTLPHRGEVLGMAGLYTINRQDVHPIVGPTSIDGYLVCNGFSGHGFKESPMVASMMAQHITGERAPYDTDVPIEFFSIDRQPLAGTGMNVLA